MSFVDAKLHDGRLDGFQHVDMPDDRDTWRQVAQGLDEAARAARRRALRRTPTSRLQREIVGAFADGEPERAGSGTSCRRRPRGRW